MLHLRDVGAANVARGHAVAVRADESVDAEAERAPVRLDAAELLEDLGGNGGDGGELIGVAGCEERDDAFRGRMQGCLGFAEGLQLGGYGDGTRKVALVDFELGHAEIEVYGGLVVQVGENWQKVRAEVVLSGIGGGIDGVRGPLVADLQTVLDMSHRRGLVADDVLEADEQHAANEGELHGLS